MSKQDKYIERAKEIWHEYEIGQSYQMQMGFTSAFKKYRDFFEGNQWAKPTDKTRNLPRPVLNICSLIVDNKVSNILGSPVKLNFMGEHEEDTSKMTRFAEWQQKEMGQEALDEEACENGAVEGTYVYHYYWDETASGRQGEYEGALRGQIIDPLNIYVANPTETDCQRQAYIIIASREEVRAVKEMCDEGINKELIVPDDEDQSYNTTEQDNEELDKKLCTVLLRYFRKDGEVYFEKCTKQTIVNTPRALNPEINEKYLERLENGEDSEVTETPDAETDNFDQPKADLYPIEIGVWKRRKNCIFGRGEVEEIIPNQKAINFEIAMELLNHQELGWGKILVKANALNGQVIDNTPGQVITDYTPGNQWGITRLDGSQMTAAGTQIVATLMEQTRVCNNASEILTGEVLSKDLSGVAIQQIQAQAQKPVAKLQRAFWRSKERIGKILEMFYKFYYEDTEFTYDLKPDEMQTIRERDRQMGINRDIQKTQFDVFNGEEFKGEKFSVVVEAGAGTRFSEIMAMDTLNTLFINGTIDRMSNERLEQFITLYPDSAMPFKSELRAIIKAQKESELGILKQATEEQKVQIEQLSSYAQSLETVNKNLEAQVKQMENLIAKQEKGYQGRIKKQNEILGKMFGSMLEDNENKTKAQPNNNASKGMKQTDTSLQQ
jgi:hypothetical protein